MAYPRQRFTKYFAALLLLNSCMLPSLGGISRWPVTNSAQRRSWNLNVNASADIDDLIESADDALFKQFIADPNRVVAYLLPDKADVHYDSDFRPGRHYRQLITKLSELYDDNIFVRQSYWSKPSVSF